MGDSWEITPAALGTTETALRESTNDALTGPPRDEVKAQLAREKGWVEQQNFNYGATIPPQNAPADMTFAGGDETPGWMHRARKYEWRDEYGDIGPEVPELATELFGSELRLKKGFHFNQCIFTCSFILLC